MRLIQRWKQTALHNKALVFTSFLVAFGTIFYAGAAVVQICILKESSETTSAQNSKLIQQADRIATAMEVSINGSKAALDASIEISRLDQRAWVSVKMYTIKLTGTDKPVTVEITLTNTGKTPAYIDNVGTLLSVRPASFDLRTLSKNDLLKLNRNATTNNIVVPPSSEPWISTGPLATSGVLIKAIQDGTARVRVAGTIGYRDVFKKRRTTEFCAIYNVTSNDWGPCNNHNYVD
jgi:hypothetical protein